ncbi:MAG: GNAT family N-acetyltransferase [Ilumatobacter sp.]
MEAGAGDPDEIAFVEIAADSPAAMSAMRAYVQELDERFPERFDIGDGFDQHELDQMGPPAGAFIVVECDGNTVGCVGLRSLGGGRGEIKRMWLDGSLRGRGVAKRLLAHVENVATQRGHEQVVLDTNASLSEAIGLYERAGYVAIERYNDNPYAHHWFAKRLT